MIKLLLIFLCNFIFIQQNFANDKVNLQLVWKNQFQFAGYYMAKEKGFYKELGLDVDIKEYQSSMNNVEDVISAKTDFAVGRSSLLLDRLEGKPVVMLAAIFQHSPEIILAKKRSDLQHVKDLEGKRIMLTDDQIGLVPINSMLIAAGVQSDKFTRQQHSFDVNDLINDKTDAIIAYLSNEPYALIQANIEYIIFNPRDYGFDLYSDILFTSQNMVEKKPDIVTNFLQASLQGWEYALQNINETVDVIFNQHNTQNRSKEALHFEGMAIKKLVDQENIPLGNIRQKKIGENIQLYRLMGLVKGNQNLDGLIYKLPEAAKPSIFTQEEKTWINSNTVKVGIEPWAPISYFENGQAKGLSADILSLVIEKTGLKVELVNQSWNDLLSGFKEKKIDLLPDANYTEERQQYGLFSQPYFTIRENIYIKENNKSIQSFEDLSYKSIAIVKGSTTITAIKKYYSDIKVIETKDFMQSVQLVLNGQADALLESQISAEYFFQEHGIYNLKGIPQFSLKGNKLHFLSRIDQPVLQSILQKGLDAISRQEKKQVIKQWITEKSNIHFTTQEQQWLDSRIPLRYVYNPDWAPFEWTNDVGQHAGFISDIIRLLKIKSGLNLHHIPTKSWAQATELVKARSADMYSAVGVTQERKSYMNFSNKTLFSTPYVFVSRQGGNFTQGFEHFNKTDSAIKLAVVGNYTIHGIMQKNKPDVPLILLNGTNEGFDKLLSKEIDIFLVNTVTANYFLNKSVYQNLKIAYKTDYKLELHVAVRNDWSAEALSIIDKTIVSFDEYELNDIYEKWAKPLKPTQQFDYRGLHEEISNLSFFELMQLEEVLFAAFIVSLLAYLIYQNYSRSKFLNIRFNRFILFIIGFELFMIFFIIYELMVLDRYENSLANVNLDKFEMVKMADKLRQSSDDLSHYSRSYAVTSNLQYKQNFLDILAIRNGTKARPEDYDAIYWDLEPELREHHHPDGDKIALKALIAKLPYSKEELDLLKQSEDNSDELVSLEAKAFKAMEEKNQPLAIELLHSKAYDQAKSEIMHPLDDMLNSINNRSDTKIHLLNQKITMAYRTIEIASIIFVLGNFIIYLMLIKKIREPLSYLIDTILKIKSGSKVIEQKIFYSDELGTMSSEFFSMRKLIQEQMDEQIKAEEKTRLLLTSVGEGIFGVASDGLVNFINPAALQMLQYHESEILGQKIHAIIHHTHADGTAYPVEECPMYHAFSEGKISHIDDEVLWRKDGTSFPVEYKSRPILRDNQISGSVVTFSDITERINAHNLLLKQQLEIQEIHKQTRDSIKYAALIQGALVPDNTIFKKYFKEFFAIWHPKDIVGGDIYLIEEVSEDEVIIMVIDCTGHGVPGAFVTMLVKAIERQLTANLHKDNVISPANMLGIFNKSIKHLLQQDNIDSISNAGFDGGILYYNKKEKIVRFAGANTPLFIIQNSGLKTIKGNRHSIGYKKSDADYEFTDHIIDVSSSTQVYITTDGYLDQNGGKKGFPYGKKRFTQFILENAGESFSDQQELLLYELQKYENGEERNDDVTVIGLKI